MTPQLLQSIKILTLPMQELKLRIEEELEQNPALEVTVEPATLSLDETAERTEDRAEYEEAPDYVTSGGTFDGDEDAQRAFLEGALSRPESLHEHLLWQLRLEPLSPEEQELGELLIMNLDDNGFHIEPPEQVREGLSPDAVAPLLEVIHGLDPVGCGVTDYRESLIVQTMLDPAAPEGALEIVRDHLELLERGRERDIAKVASLPPDLMAVAIAYVRTLSPFPGRAFAPDDATYVIPDLVLTRRDGQFVLQFNDEEFPVLGVSPAYRAATRSGSADEKRFAAGAVREAQWFISAIEQRNSTLLRVGRAILDFQRDFFVKGRKYLRPLTLRDIAEEIEMSEATISRVTNGKYIQTEWGIFELKHFFSNRVGGSDAGMGIYSKAGVKEMVREILTGEGGAALSDQRITDLLGQRGVKIARRTVAKYRKELNISSSYERA